MKEEIKMIAQSRTEKGKGAVNRLRRQGLVPGVMYGSSTPKNVTINAHEFMQLMRKHASDNLMLDLEIEGVGSHKVLIREVQRHPLRAEPVHVDFYELSLTERVRVSVPLELVGEPVGVTQQGGVLEHLVREVEVECLPSDIPDRFELDVSAMELGQRLAVRDIPLDLTQFEMLTVADVAVAAVAAPRVEAEPVVAEAAEEEEPTVLNEKKKDEEPAKDDKAKAEKKK